MNKKEEVENEEDTGGEDVKEVNQGEKNFKETEEAKELKELENTSEGGDVKREEEMRNEWNTGEKGKGEKRNSFRLDYIAHMIRR